MARILVIDDDPMILDVIGEMLELEGHEVAKFDSGSDGVRAFRTNNFDLVITDLVMPEMGGLEAIQHMREVSRSVPIIAISGGGLTPADILLSNAEILGANAVLAKPFTNAVLRVAVKSLLSG